MKRHKHKWQFASENINSQRSGLDSYTYWACPCGAYKGELVEWVD